MKYTKQPKSPVGIFIYKRMKELGIKNRSKLADVTGLSRTAIYSIFRDDISMRASTARKLAKGLQCNPDDILELTKPMPERTWEIPNEFPETSRQLCWTCANAVPDKNYGCNWSKHLKPVPGWIAEPDDKSGNQTYKVKSCPLYRPDEAEEDSPEPGEKTVFDKWCKEKGVW